MYKHLYDNFKHWFHGNRGEVYFYSDPHFADEEMKYIRKNYIGDEEQVKRINSKIGKYDTLVILGDVGDVEWVKKLRGYKVLIMGNHDAGASNYQRVAICDAEKTRQNMMSGNPTVAYKEDNHLFDEVYEGALIISEKLILSHEPIDFPYALNIHGHSHSAPLHVDKKHWNVCAELINYTPICLKDIIQSGYLKNIIDMHRETIDNATKKANGKKKI